MGDVPQAIGRHATFRMADMEFHSQCSVQPVRQTLFVDPGEGGGGGAVLPFAMVAFGYISL